MRTSSPVLQALLPVVLLIAVGYGTGRKNWVSPVGIKELSNLAFYVLGPALLFRTMSEVNIVSMDLQPIWAYFAVAIAIFLMVWVWNKRSRAAAVLALAAIFSNTLMIGVPLIHLTYGKSGLVLLFTLISLHALILLTLATLALELSVQTTPLCASHTDSNESNSTDHRNNLSKFLRILGTALRNTLLHPVPLPILLGIVWGQLGLTTPASIDKVLQIMGAAFSPIALLLVGIGLSHTRLSSTMHASLRMVFLKNVLHPLLMALVGWLLGLNGLAWSVMVIAASLPIGANVFLFSQRYDVAQDLINNAVAISTIAALVSISLFMYWVV